MKHNCTEQKHAEEAEKLGQIKGKLKHLEYCRRQLEQGVILDFRKKIVSKDDNTGESKEAMLQRNEGLRKENIELKVKLARLRQKVAELEGRVGRNNNNNVSLVSEVSTRPSEGRPSNNKSTRIPKPSTGLFSWKSSLSSARDSKDSMTSKPSAVLDSVSARGNNSTATRESMMPMEQVEEMSVSKKKSAMSKRGSFRSSTVSSAKKSQNSKEKSPKRSVSSPVHRDSCQQSEDGGMKMVRGVVGDNKHSVKRVDNDENNNMMSNSRVTDNNVNINNIGESCSGTIVDKESVIINSMVDPRLSPEKPETDCVEIMEEMGIAGRGLEEFEKNGTPSFPKFVPSEYEDNSLKSAKPVSFYFSEEGSRKTPVVNRACQSAPPLHGARTVPLGGLMNTKESQKFEMRYIPESTASPTTPEKVFTPKVSAAGTGSTSYVKRSTNLPMFEFKGRGTLQMVEPNTDLMESLSNCREFHDIPDNVTNASPECNKNVIMPPTSPTALNKKSVAMPPTSPTALNRESLNNNIMPAARDTTNSVVVRAPSVMNNNGNHGPQMTVRSSRVISEKVVSVTPCEDRKRVVSTKWRNNEPPHSVYVPPVTAKPSGVYQPKFCSMNFPFTFTPAAPEQLQNMNQDKPFETAQEQLFVPAAAPAPRSSSMQLRNSSNLLEVSDFMSAVPSSGNLSQLVTPRSVAGTLSPQPSGFVTPQHADPSPAPAPERPQNTQQFMTCNQIPASHASMVLQPVANKNKFFVQGSKSFTAGVPQRDFRVVQDDESEEPDRNTEGEEQSSPTVVDKSNKEPNVNVVPTPQMTENGKKFVSAVKAITARALREFRQNHRRTLQNELARGQCVEPREFRQQGMEPRGTV